MLTVAGTMPVQANAAGRQPTGISVRCGDGNYVSLSELLSCSIVVNYDDQTADVAYYTGYGDNTSQKYVWDGATSNMVIGGGYSPKTDCKATSMEYTTSMDFSSGCLTVGLKTKPVSQPTAATVMQMPTTGAPEGLSTAGMIAIGIGLLAVAVAVVKRERI